MGNLNSNNKQYIDTLRQYAGEFVVIVLGVLAAFAIDRWSDDRRDRELEESYLVRLKGDLSRDLEQVGFARWASFAQARATTTLLYSINDPLAAEVPIFTKSSESIDFSVPATEVIDGATMGGLVWLSFRTRTLNPSRGTYDEMLATGRFLVINDDQLRGSVIDYYSYVEDSEQLGVWISESTERLQTVLQPTGLNAFDYNYVDDPVSKLQELDEVGAALRDIRRRSLRYVSFLEQAREKARALVARIDETTKPD